MVYDALDGYTLFVGEDGSSSLMETWAFSEGSWTNLTTDQKYALPSGQNLGMAYDASDNYVVLFDSGTWTFAHGQWAPQSTSVAPPLDLEGEGMVYDAHDNYVLLFGGTYCSFQYGCATTDATWEYNYGAWQNITSTAGTPPSARSFPSIAYDAANGVVVLFGGESPAGSALGDTYEFENGVWGAALSGTAPAARYAAPMTYDPNEAYVVLFGGSDCQSNDPAVCDETWEYGDGSWAQESPATSPPQEAGANEAMDADGAGGYVLLVEGPSATNETTFWEWPVLVVLSVSAANSAVDLSQSVDLTATMTGGQSPYSYSWSDLPPGCGSLDYRYLNCTPTQMGNWNVEVTSKDSLGRGQSLTVSIAVLSDPAASAPAPDYPRSDLGTPVELRTTATGGSGGYSYTWIDSPNEGCSASATSWIVCTPPTSGGYPVSVTVTDSNGFAVDSPQTTFTVYGGLTVTLAENRTNLDLGQSIFFWANVTGGTGIYSYAYNGLPSGCATANSSNLVCTPSSTYSSVGVSVTVTDTGAGSATSPSVSFVVHSDPTRTSSWVVGSWVLNESGTWDAYVNASATYQTTLVGGEPNFEYCVETLPTTAYSACSGWTGQTTFDWGFIFSAGFGMSPGTYTLSFSAEDSTGWNESYSVRVQLFYESSVGAVSLKQEVDSGETANLSAVISHGAPPVNYWWNDSTGVTVCAERSVSTSSVVYCDFIATSSGSVTLYTRDFLGRLENSTVSLTVPPGPSGQFAQAPAEALVGRAFSVEVQVSGGWSPYQFCLQTGSPSSGPCSAVSSRPDQWFNLTAAKAGTWMIGVNVADAAGENRTAWTNVSILSILTGLGVDAGSTWSYAGATVSLDLNWTGGFGQFSVWTNDTNASGLLCSQSGVTSQRAGCSFVPTWLGNHTLLMTVRDADGEARTFGWYVNVYPDIAVTSAWVSSGPSNSSRAGILYLENGGPVWLNMSFAGGVAGPRDYSWWLLEGGSQLELGQADGSSTSYDLQWNPVGFAPGAQIELVGQIEDTFGTVYRSTAIGATVLGGLGSLVGVASLPTTEEGLETNLSVGFQGGVGPFSYVWEEFTPGIPVRLGTTSVPYLVWTPPPEWPFGAFEAHVIITDAFGDVASTGINLTVIPALAASCAPVVTTGVAEVGVLLTFSVSCVVGGLVPDTFVWSFGDGTGASTPNLNSSHRYSAPGSFRVDLRITDSLGVVVESPALNLTIIPVPPPSSPQGSGSILLTEALSVSALLIAAILLVAGLVSRSRRRRNGGSAEGGPVDPFTGVDRDSRSILEKDGPQKESDLSAEVAQRTGVDGDLVRSRLRALAQEGSLVRVEKGGISTYHLPEQVAETVDAEELRQMAELPRRILDTIAKNGPVDLAKICETAQLSREEVMIALIQLQRDGRVLLLPQSAESSDPVYVLAPKGHDPDEDDPPERVQVDEGMLQDFLTRRDSEVESPGSEMDPEGEPAEPE